MWSNHHLVLLSILDKVFEIRYTSCLVLFGVLFDLEFQFTKTSIIVRDNSILRKQNHAW